VDGNNYNTELRWLRTWAHRLVMDPFYSGAVEGVEAQGSDPLPHCFYLAPIDCPKQSSPVAN
jgi:hypothetical protein